MSRLSEEKKTVEQVQNLIKEALPKLKEASRLLNVEAGFCGLPPGSKLSQSIRSLERLSELSTQDGIF